MRLRIRGEELTISKIKVSSHNATGWNNYITPIFQMIDEAHEVSLGDESIGATGRETTSHKEWNNNCGGEVKVYELESIPVSSIRHEEK